MHQKFEQCVERMPLFAVLRGIQPDEVQDVGAALVDAGITILEVTLNSPDPFSSIEKLANNFRDAALVGAGTVTTPEDVARVHEAGGEIIISPNMDVEVIAASKQRRLLSLPGCFTPSEAFTALQAGADGLKLFPAELISPKALKAMRAVLPKATKIFVVGGVSADNMHEYVTVGASGFGAGSSLYKPGKSTADIAADAREIAKNLKDAFVRAGANGS